MCPPLDQEVKKFLGLEPVRYEGVAQSDGSKCSGVAVPGGEDEAIGQRGQSEWAEVGRRRGGQVPSAAPPAGGPIREGQLPAPRIPACLQPLKAPGPGHTARPALRHA